MTSPVFPPERVTKILPKDVLSPPWERLKPLANGMDGVSVTCDPALENLAQWARSESIVSALKIF